MTTKLSPAAQAVLNAYRDADIDDAVTAAAVLRAAAEQGETFYLEGCPVHAVTVGNLLAIAAELEAQ